VNYGLVIVALGLIIALTIVRRRAVQPMKLVEKAEEA